jgi:peroxiredoxin Q/BCP
MSTVSPLCGGTEAPAFSTTDDQAVPVSRESLLGKKYLLYFYPRDNTPGCTAEACGFRDLLKDFEKKNTLIFGVSGDSVKSHQKFRKKFDLPFPLLMDEDHSLAKAFGVWGEKKFMGRTFDGIHRMSFLVDEAGKIEKAYHKVKAKEHPAEVLSGL